MNLKKSTPNLVSGILPQPTSGQIMHFRLTGSQTLEFVKPKKSRNQLEIVTHPAELKQLLLISDPFPIIEKILFFLTDQYYFN